MPDEGFEMIDVGVNVTVGEKTDQMQRRFMLTDIVDDLPPGAALEELPGLDGLADQCCSLVINLAGADGIVAHLRVTHVAIAWHTYGGAMSLQHGMGILFE
jgi:hypothetical protein